MKYNIGFHVPAAGGYAAMVDRAAAAGANTFQYFTRNPRGGAVRAHDEADMQAANRKMREYGMGNIVAHAPYTLNPCAADENTLKFAYMAFKDDLARIQGMPNAMYNLHPGCHVGQGIERGLEKLAAFLNDCIPDGFQNWVLLETMAGKGSELGGTFDQLKWVIDHVKPGVNVGVCLDTCHVFDAGYDIRNIGAVLDEFDRVIGLDLLKAVHINDSQNSIGSRKDRHACLGEGEIGWQPFVDVVTEPRLSHLPMILETPTEFEDRAEEIRILRAACEDNSACA